MTEPLSEPSTLDFCYGIVNDVIGLIKHLKNPLLTE